MNGNHIAALEDCRNDLNIIKEKINQNRFDSTVRYLNSYAVVKICGTFEIIFKEILFDYLSVNANDENKRFLTVHIIDSSSNPSTGKVSTFLQNMNVSWKERFDLAVKEENQGKVALNSLVNFRNDFAHGRNFSCSIENIIKYFESAIFIFDTLYEIINTETQD